MRDLNRVQSSRAIVNKKPREIDKKNPGKTYLPRFLDMSNVENLKSSVERELADISMYMEKERQIVSKIVPGSDFKGQWDACSDKYPVAKENSTWDVNVSCGASHVFDGKTWLPGQQLIYLHSSNTYLQRTNPGTDGIKHEVELLKVEVDNAKTKIEQNKVAIAETNFAMGELRVDLEAKVNDNTSKINQTNQVVSDLTSTVASNKTELESSITGVRNVVDANKAASEQADAENRQLIVEAESKIAVTNTTVANLEKTVATNKLEMDSKFTIVDGEINDANNEIAKTNAQLAITNETVANLEGSISTNVTELRAEYKAADAKVASDAAADAKNKADKVAVDAAANLAITNQTVANLSQSMAQNITRLESEYKAGDSKVAKDAADDATSKANKVASDAAAALAITNKTVADLDKAMSQNVTELRSEYKTADAKVANDAATDATNKANAVATKAAADLAITNQTIADLTSSTATNITQLRSEYQAADAKVAADAAADAKNKADAVAVKAAADLAVTNKTVADLDKALAENVTTLRSEYKSADSLVASNAASDAQAKADAVATKAAADLAITNQTVADNKQAAASATTALKSEMDGKVATINSQMSTVSNKVGTLESKWTVQADVNGKISGIEMINNGRQSNFTIQTDRFVVTDGSTTRAPFSIEGGRVAMRDAVVSGTIQANSGEFRNVTIYEDCNFLGTITAERIRGDMYSVTARDNGKRQIYTDNSWVTASTLHIPHASYERWLILEPSSFNNPSAVSSGRCNMRILFNGGQISIGQENDSIARTSVQYYRMPPGSHTVVIQVFMVRYHGAASFGYYTGIESAEVFRVSAEGFNFS